jgi:hypothetical protein
MSVLFSKIDYLHSYFYFGRLKDRGRYKDVARSRKELFSFVVFVMAFITMCYGTRQSMAALIAAARTILLVLRMGTYGWERK